MNTAYRVWDGQQMFYGDDEGISLIIKNNGEWYLWSDETGECVVLSDDEDAVLMWGTGLKDKNGKMIYNTDFILDHYTDTKFVVKYDNKQAGFYLDIGIGNGSGAFMVGDLEVIGDAYQNPELLEGTE
ncbi:YopX family protein [Bacillus atrophaeus]|uniref:YopX family protein n=1 Tax=Bacillus atrophaeus TaxID=1452 RepID=UPI002DB5C48D|nr:YopX family protein [Bacillus atrophaeus]MEC2307673.1 YopX family protein [Bacillus atrophaeus]